MSLPSTVRFRDSAAVVLVRGHGGRLEVFWVLRSDAVAYMPGFRAFVGGTVDPGDAELEIEGAREERERLLVACAIREAFEETGVLIGVENPSPEPERARARRRLLAGEVSFATLARELGWRFDARRLSMAGRWTTPPFSAARFDTSYFLVHLPQGQEPIVQDGELESGEWIPPQRALELWKEGTVTFAAPILHTLIELARGEEELVERLATAPQRAWQPIHKIELKWGIVLQPMKTLPLPPATHTNAYLVGEREMALIDPGSDQAEELGALFQLIDALASEGRALSMILLTHHHVDHTAGAAAVSERYRVPIAAHPLTAERVRVDRTLLGGEVILLAAGMGEWNLRVIHTPGHAPGHLCFLHERTRSLLTGDHVPGGKTTVIIDPPDGDMAAYIASLEALLHQPIETLFPGHGAPQGAAHRRIRWLIDHRLEREAKILGALADGPLTLGPLVERAYADTPRQLWPYAERSLLAHLIKLDREGRVAEEAVGWRITGSGRP